MGLATIKRIVNHDIPAGIDGDSWCAPAVAGAVVRSQIVLWHDVKDVAVGDTRWKPRDNFFVIGHRVIPFEQRR